MTIRDNLLAARAAIEAEPEAGLDLKEFENHCGTIHCALGLLATLPFFNAQGLTMCRTSEGMPVPYLGVEFMYIGWRNNIDEMFGKGSYFRLFEARGCSTWDDELLGSDRPRMLNDKQLALARLDKQLELYP